MCRGASARLPSGAKRAPVDEIEAREFVRGRTYSVLDSVSSAEWEGIPVPFGRKPGLLDGARTEVLINLCPRWRLTERLTGTVCPDPARNRVSRPSSRMGAAVLAGRFAIRSALFGV